LHLFSIDGYKYINRIRKWENDIFVRSQEARTRNQEPRARSQEPRRGSASLKIAVFIQTTDNRQLITEQGIKNKDEEVLV
jgi:hypothetical protein